MKVKNRIEAVSKMSIKYCGRIKRRREGLAKCREMMPDPGGIHKDDSGPQFPVIHVERIILGLLHFVCLNHLFVK